ncbi:MAG: ABC transporter ATP-binding protein [Bacilli bacterium]|nr:ABC transporter ATP-binding protein [Bacilli bacterium]
MIEFQNVSKSYKEKKILENINLVIENNSIVVLIGESGCGKTTTLKMINRLIEPTKGKILINGKDIKKTNPIKLRRSIGYVIQQTGLFPHLTIRQNIELISKLEKKEKKMIQEKTIELMKMVGLSEELLDSYPSELSGGQQQRVGIARAFATDPDIILMDEPFSALDPITRSSLQDEVIRLQDKLKKIIIFVTHDMDEAIKLADKIAIMEQGKVVQYDRPEKILKQPVNEFVRNFVGEKRIWDSPKLIKVKDIMMEHPNCCKENFSVFYCLNKMRMNKTDTLLVIDNEQKLKGILYADSLFNINYENKKAKDFIEDDFITASPNDNIVDLLKIMKENNIKLVPVVDSKNKLKGLITKSSLITSLSQQFLESEGKDGIL